MLVGNYFRTHATYLTNTEPQLNETKDTFDREENNQKNTSIKEYYDYLKEKTGKNDILPVIITCNFGDLF